VLIGNAVVHEQNHGEAHGDKLTYNTNTAYMTGDSAGDGFVHMIFLPKPKPAAASPAPAKGGATTPASTPHPATPSTTNPAPAASTPATPAALPASAGSAATPAKGQP
jgi:lipopolysaccharide export system protein LptA